MKRIAVALMAASLAGCCTFRTTAIDRCENYTIVVNPEDPINGIPVALRIPTHLELQVIETTYWQKELDATTGQSTLVPLRTCRPTRTVMHTVRETEKIFVVDPVRPAAGLQNYGFEFVSNGTDDKSKAAAGKGYIRNVTYKADDQTITQSAGLIANSLGLIEAFQKSANQGAPNTSDLISTDRVVAFGRFDINTECFEGDVSQFLECHLNSAPAGTCATICQGSFCK
jgi:hypothetical protein